MCILFVRTSLTLKNSTDSILKSWDLSCDLQALQGGRQGVVIREWGRWGIGVFVMGVEAGDRIDIEILND